MRDLSNIIESLLEIVDEPMLVADLRYCQKNIGFTAPEAMVTRWQEAAAILINWSHRSSDYALQDKARKIFIGV